MKSCSKKNQNIVKLGTTVVVENDGRIDKFEIVNSLNANPSLGRISDESPVGKALLGHKIGDVVEIKTPIGITYNYKILKIKYNK